MKKIFFTVGPSKLYPTVLEHLASALAEEIPSISHRSEAFQDIFKETISGLRTLFGIPQEYSVFFVTSGTEGMERAIQNCVKEESFHFISGAFAKKFHTTAVALKKKTVKKSIASRNDLLTSIPASAEAVCFTQNETSTGIAIPPDAIYEIKKRHPEKLLLIDIVSSVPSVALDYRFTDCAFFSVQKGFGLPAGLGVMIVSPAALEKARQLKETGINVSWYHSFGELSKYADRNQTPETPNVLAVYLLGKVIEDMRKAGIGTIRKAIDARAEALYRFFEEEQSRFSLNVSYAEFRSKTTIIITTEENSKTIADRLASKGIVVGLGYGDRKEDQIRIANFPAHTDADFEALFSALKN